MGEGGLSELGHFYTLSEHNGMFWILDDSITKGPYSWEDVSKIASGEKKQVNIRLHAAVLKRIRIRSRSE